MKKIYIYAIATPDRLEVRIRDEVACSRLFFAVVVVVVAVAVVVPLAGVFFSSSSIYFEQRLQTDQQSLHLLVHPDPLL